MRGVDLRGQLTLTTSPWTANELLDVMVTCVGEWLLLKERASWPSPVGKGVVCEVRAIARRRRRRLRSGPHSLGRLAIASAQPSQGRQALSSLPSSTMIMTSPVWSRCQQDEVIEEWR